MAPFTVDDLAVVNRLALDAWTAGLDQDWALPAGTLDWTCFATADHTVDCVFSYALFLASGAQEAYPKIGELHAEPGATPEDLVQGLRAVTTILVAVIATADPTSRAIFRMRPAPETALAPDFAPRGALELALHTHDICSGLGVPFAPPDDVCRRLFDATADWPVHAGPVTPTGDAWGDLLERSGRPRP